MISFTAACYVFRQRHTMFTPAFVHKGWHTYRLGVLLRTGQDLPKSPLGGVIA